MDDELEKAYRDLELEPTNVPLLDRIIELETDRGYPDAVTRSLWVAAHHLEQAKDGAGTLAVLERLVRLDAGSTRNLLALAATCARLHLPSQAMPYFGRAAAALENRGPVERVTWAISLCKLRHNVPALAHAIAEPWISRLNEQDVHELQHLGEMFQKMGDDVAAAGWFARVAEHYAKDGFFLKAIALFKQVIKLDPTLTPLELRLGELHATLQLHSEAAAYFKRAADNFTRSGDLVGAATARRRLAELPS